MFVFLNRRGMAIGLGAVAILVLLAWWVRLERFERVVLSIVADGTWGAAPGQLGLLKARDGGWAGPGGLAILADGSICVADTQNARVQCLRQGGWQVTWQGKAAEAPRLLAARGEDELLGATSDGVIYAYRDGERSSLVTLTPAALPGVPDVGRVERLLLEGMAPDAAGRPVVDVVVLGRLGSYRLVSTIEGGRPVRTWFSVYQPGQGESVRVPRDLGPGAVGSWTAGASDLYVETRSGEGFARTIFRLENGRPVQSFTINFSSPIRGFSLVGGWADGVYTLTWDQDHVYRVTKYTAQGRRLWEAVVARPGELAWGATAEAGGGTIAVLAGNETGWQMLVLKSETKWHLHIRGR